MTKEEYWTQGTQIIQQCLEKSQRAEHQDAPFPLDAEQAVLWHRAQMEAYAHALDMMGYNGEAAN